MTDITYPDFNLGDYVTAPNMNEIKMAVNSKYDADRQSGHRGSGVRRGLRQADLRRAGEQRRRTRAGPEHGPEPEHPHDG